MTDIPPRVPCPRCQEPSAPRPDNRAWPFCSDRCKWLDLGAWMDGSYRIPVGADASERTLPGTDELQLAAGLPPEQDEVC